MAYIKQYRISGINYKDESYEMVQDFNHLQGGSVHNATYIEGVGYPQKIAEALVVRWNATVDLYRRQDPEYRGPTYSLVIPEPDIVRPASVVDSYESEEAAYELIRYGQWTLTEFQAWMHKVVDQAYDDGRKNVLNDLRWRE
jgi:hypothetical protein